MLHVAGLPQARIAAIEGISERSVRTICGEAPIEDPRDLGWARERGVGRPSVVEVWREQVVAVLAAEPALPTMEILHRLRGLREVPVSGLFVVAECRLLLIRHH